MKSKLQKLIEKYEPVVIQALDFYKNKEPSQIDYGWLIAYRILEDLKEVAKDA